jgi:hypothetical protein
MATLRKRCIVGAIYNEEILLSGSPSLPSIAPKITNSLKESIVSIITNIDPVGGKIEQMKQDIEAYKTIGSVNALREAKTIQYADEYIGSLEQPQQVVGYTCGPSFPDNIIEITKEKIQKEALKQKITRCAYCGTEPEDRNKNKCTQCGAPLKMR